MKGLARSHIWWPGIDKQIEDIVRCCLARQSIRNRPPAMPLHPWPWVHVDFAGPFMGSLFFVIVDSHSKWLEVEPVESTNAEKNIEVLTTLFARFGLPKCLMNFMAANGVLSRCDAPLIWRACSPQENGSENIPRQMLSATRLFGRASCMGAQCQGSEIGGWRGVC